MRSRARVRGLLVASVMLVGCSFHLHGRAFGDGDDGGDTPFPVADAGAGDAGPGDDSGVRSGGTDAAPPPVAPCYSEDYSPTVSLADLAASYSPQQWKTVLLTALDRRIAGGHALVAAMKDDPQLGNGVDASSFAGLMGSIYSVCNGETTGYDFGHATPSTFALWLRPDLVLAPPVVATFPRGEILAYITDDATRSYDQTYLQGQAGQDDFTFLADDVASFTNALGCATAVADQLAGGISARDGVAASLYYLELYLKRARTAHPTAYAALQGSAEWQRFVAFAWARGVFWRAAASDGTLGIADGPIWAHVDDPANSGEIEAFTGRKLPDIACHP